MLTSYLSWSWIFFINVPVGIAAIALTPVLLRESRAELAHRHFDFAGAASVTAGLMLLVYAMTRATSDGWGSRPTLGLLAAARGARAAFVVIELRSRYAAAAAADLPLRTLSAANVAMAIVGAVAFSEFFLLTLYLQDVLRYSAVQSGVAFVAFALTVVVVSNLAQLVVGRLGVRPTLTAGLLVSALSVALADTPAGRRQLLLGSLPGLRARRRRHGPLVRARHDREPDRGGARRRRRRVRADQHEPPDRRRDRPRRGQRDRSHVDESPTGRRAAALDHGFQTALYALTGLLLVGAVLAATLVRPPRTAAEPEVAVLQEAA